MSDDAAKKSVYALIERLRNAPPTPNDRLVYRVHVARTVRQRGWVDVLSTSQEDADREVLTRFTMPKHDGLVVNWWPVEGQPARRRKAATR